MKRNNLLCYVLIVLVLLSGCSRARAEDSQETKERAVVIFKTIERPIDDVIDVLGIVQPQKDIGYGPKVPGKIEAINVQEGDYIEVGQCLYQINDEDLTRAYEGAQANYAQAVEQFQWASEAYAFEKEQYEDIQVLYGCGSVSQNTYESEKLKLKSTATSVESAKQQWALAELAVQNSLSNLNETSVYASESGYVSAVLIEAEQYLATGQLGVIVSSEEKSVVFGVTVDELESFQCGDVLSVSDDYAEVRCEITRINTSPDAATQLFEVEAEFLDTNAALQIGDVLKATIKTGSNYGVMVPLSAILMDQEPYVYVVREDRVYKTPVTIINSKDGEAIVEGLESDMLIVKSGMTTLRDGDIVRLLDEEAMQ
ncbi:MAG: efflux RND transporter periplasmic adaptor subunit [Clostridia bacterium]|nr:efflux RND transporter periplasmic adaptor subunit [Clostridia bacterium]